MEKKEQTKWTAQQQAVIRTRGNNLLVSAAAGSGKTAVLVERIIRAITREQDPLSIDRLLVVTFTNAAAAEMRERIVAALGARLEEDPDNEHLIRQSTLVHQAMIMTIHSFCLELIRENALTIGIDPSFSIASEGECTLMRLKASEQLLEEMYEQPTPAFLLLSETYASGKSDASMEKMIRQFYEFSLAHPDPAQWRADCARSYEITTVRELEEAPWMQELLEKVRHAAADMRRRLERALALCMMPEGPEKYAPELDEHMQLLTELVYAGTFEEMKRCVERADSWDRSPSLRPKTDQAEKLKNQAKALRDGVKDELEKIHARYFACSSEEVLDIMGRCGICAKELVRLADRYGEIYSSLKEEAGAVDFSDLEHMALRILTERDEDGNYTPAQAALSCRERFDEVMTDEYQDSNLLQEMLLQAVSRGNNRFAVGDVKQSIYRFRLARPELFMEKYSRYKPAAVDGEDPSGEQADGLRISLARNFRSRHQVLEAVNMVFRQIMDTDLGGVAYDDEAALYPGASYPESEEAEMFRPEILLVKEGYSREDEDYGRMKEQEARCVAQRILELAGRQQVLDKETGMLRPASWRDIVILLRAMNGWGDVFLNALQEAGIPAVCDVSAGFFDAPEIRTILSCLEIVDNPRQDIPLAAVLSSPVGGFSYDDLIRIRAHLQDADFYDACMAYALDGDDPSLRGRLDAFFAQLTRFREAAVFTPVHDLIWKILDETGYVQIAEAMPGGENRVDNLSFLVSLAASYEENRYRSIFYFLRYIEKLKEADMDFPAAAASAGADCVRIMSIHRSKGLEFPVVFFCGAGKKINQMDSVAPLLIHPDMGLGVGCLDTERRLRLPVLLKNVIGEKLREETIGEELRILYVAMTRAKEKLIITGALPGDENKNREYLEKAAHAGGAESVLPRRVRLSAGSCFDLLLPAVLRHSCAEGLLASYHIEQERYAGGGNGVGGFSIRVVSCTAAAAEGGEAVQAEDGADTLLSSVEPDIVYDQQTADILAALPEENLPEGREDWKIPAKVSVSFLKAAAWSPEEDGMLMFEAPEAEAEAPAEHAAAQGEALPGDAAAKAGERPAANRGSAGGAAYGTLVHRVLELFDYKVLQDESCSGIKSFVGLQLETMAGCGKITSSERSRLREEDFVTFLSSELGRRMTLAAQSGSLHRETPFVLQVGADVIDPSYSSDVPVLVQGIIDAWFEEEDGIILADYKTDRVDALTDPDGESLVRHYRIQLALYKEALERLTCRPVKACWIYSFALGRGIRL